MNIDVGRLERQTDSAEPVNVMLYQHQQQFEEPMIAIDEVEYPSDYSDFHDVLVARMVNQQSWDPRSLSFKFNLSLTTIFMLNFVS